MTAPRALPDDAVAALAEALWLTTRKGSYSNVGLNLGWAREILGALANDGYHLSRQAPDMVRLRAIERAAVALVATDSVDNFNALCDAVGVGDEPSEPGQ